MTPRPWIAAALVLIVILAASGLASAQTITTFVPAPDGTPLATDVYLPAVGSSWPVVLIRTPYGKDSKQLECLAFTLAGFACVAQDTRGRFESGGTDTVFRNDGPDGRAAVDWVADQSWCNGSIGTYGGSAEGITQYALAPGANPALKCMLPAVATPSIRDHAFLQGGALRTALVETWLAEQGSLFFLDDLKAHRLLDDWWQRLDFLGGTAAVTTEVLHVGGWYDVFQQGAIDGFRAYQQRGGSGARGRQHLIMGPWTHGGNAGELDYGVDPEELLMSVVPPWFEHCLKSVSNEVDDWPAVSVYLMGAVGEPGAPGNTWVDLAGWPPAARTLPLYLDVAGGLRMSLPATGETALVIDPGDPVPTLGGGNLFPWLEVDGREMGAGSYDQRAIESRDDVLVFSTDVLDESVTVMGRVRARLWVRPDTPDLDLAVRLTDVYPDGRSMLVLDGVQRARMRCSADRECFLTPGEPAEIVVDLWSTAIVFNAGHRIRVDVSGTNAPRFEVNPNDGSDLDNPDGRIVARPVLLHGAGAPSRLELPVPAPPRRPAGRRSGASGASALFNPR